MQKNFTKAVEIDLGVPDEHVELAGFYPPRAWDGYGGELKASLLVTDLPDGTKLVFGSIDTLFVDAQFYSALAKALGKNYRLNIIASHTHNAPSLTRTLPKLGKVSDGWFNNVITRIEAAIKHGDSVELIEIGYGSVKTDLVINRRRDAWLFDYKSLKRGRLRFRKTVALAPNSTGKVDDKIKAVLFRCAAGKVRTIVWSLSAHAAFGSKYSAISADFPGIVRQCLKEKYGDELISIFLPGFAGSSIPKCFQKYNYKQSVKQFLISLLPFNKSIPSADSNAYLLWSKRAAGFIEGIVETASWKGLGQMPSQHVRGDPITVFKDRDLGDVALLINAVSFGNELKIITMNGELLSEWADSMNDLSKLGDFHLISGYGPGDCLYIPPDREVARGGYEVERFQDFFGLSGRFVENIDIEVRNGINVVLRRFG
jgi:hypothetical protein